MLGKLLDLFPQASSRQNAITRIGRTCHRNHLIDLKELISITPRTSQNQHAQHVIEIISTNPPFPVCPDYPGTNLTVLGKDSKKPTRDFRAQADRPPQWQDIIIALFVARFNRQKIHANGGRRSEKPLCTELPPFAVFAYNSRHLTAAEESGPCRRLL